MATLSTEKPRVLCPPGNHVVTLVEVTTYMPKQGYGGKPPQEKLIWRFVSHLKSPETNEYYEVPVFTGYKYGNGKATLTGLLDMIWPGVTPELAEGMDTDQFLGTRYESLVKHERQDPTADPFPVFVYLRPMGAAAAAQAAAHAEKADPFSDDAMQEGASVPSAEDELGEAACGDCGKTLNYDEIVGCRKHFGAARWCAEHGKAHKKAVK